MVAGSGEPPSAGSLGTKAPPPWPFLSIGHVRLSCPPAPMLFPGHLSTVCPVIGSKKPLSQQAFFCPTWFLSPLWAVALFPYIQFLGSKVEWSCVFRFLQCFCYYDSSSSLFHLIYSYSQPLSTSVQNHLRDGWEAHRGTARKHP